jgi:hypothetical protein
MIGINLERMLPVRCWRVIGQVAKAAKRAELMPVLLRARERGETDAGDVAGHLLFESASRRVVAQRLLQIAEVYGLLEQRDRRYRLTETGETALATKQVFVPEHGTWTVWASDDPLLATRILRVEPWAEPTAYDEVWGKERDSSRERKFEKLPQWVRNAVGVVANPLTGGASLRIDQLQADAEVAEPESTLRVAWDVSAARLRVDGALGGAHVNAVVDAPQIGAEAVWIQLLQADGLWSKWDASARALRVTFEDATPGERESLVRAVTFQRPKFASVGAFDKTTVEGVALRASSGRDADRWAAWRLKSRVTDYATEERFQQWTDAAYAPFSEFSPGKPTRRSFANDAWKERNERPSSLAWHLVAAEDWGF